MHQCLNENCNHVMTKKMYIQTQILLNREIATALEVNGCATNDDKKKFILLFLKKFL